MYIVQQFILTGTRAVQALTRGDSMIKMAVARQSWVTFFSSSSFFPVSPFRCYTAVRAVVVARGKERCVEKVTDLRRRHREGESWPRWHFLSGWKRAHFTFPRFVPHRPPPRLCHAARWHWALVSLLQCGGGHRRGGGGCRWHSGAGGCKFKAQLGPV